MPQLDDLEIMVDTKKHTLVSAYVHDQTGRKFKRSTPARPHRGCAGHR